MADEVRVTAGLTITKDNLKHRPAITAFTDDMAVAKGPSPGAITISQYGQLIDLSQISQPGWCEIINAGDAGTFEYGIYDLDSDKVFPWGELGPGMKAVFKFSRNFLEDYTSTGTGTTGPTNRLWARSLSSTECEAVFFVFDA